MKMRNFIALLGIVVFAVSTPAAAEKRVALVIANDHYQHLPQLNNAGKDGHDMAAKLQALGFEVISAFNASRREMGRAIERFADKLGSGTTGLVFYAGHGVQSEGKNYLIPVDAELEEEIDLPYSAIDSNRVLTAMRDAGNDLNIVILDACRDNPLPKRSRGGVSRGLAVVQVPMGVKGTAILYAAAPGQTAADGDTGKNGIFTGALLRYMDKPGWTLEKVFKATVRDVAEESHRKQTPWQQVSMQGDFIFKKTPVVVATDNTGTSRTINPNRQVATIPDSSSDIALWQAVQNSNNPAMLQAYLNKFPNGTFAEVAKIKLAALQGGANTDNATKGSSDSVDQNTNSEVDQSDNNNKGNGDNSDAAQQLVSVNADYVVITNANVRLKPSVNGARLATLQVGERVRVAARTEDGSWLRVERNGQTLGYVYHTLLRPQADIDREEQNKRDEARRRAEEERKKQQLDEQRKQLVLKTPINPAPVTRQISARDAANLGYKYYSGTGGMPRDYTQAARYYYYAAQNGNPTGMHGVGYMYEFGLGVRKNYSEAFYWYRRAVQNNLVMAYSNLGYMYQHGHGVQQDYNEAARLYRKGANAGDPRSANNLASLYEVGKGVPKNRSEAIYWYRKAAAKGDDLAKKNLTRLGVN